MTQPPRGTNGAGASQRLSKPRVALILAATLALVATSSWWITHFVDSRRAEEVLAAETREARDEGERQGYADGIADGHQDGYDEGYETGKSEVSSAADEAFDKGFAEGKEAGLERGKRQGEFAGWSEGYDEGWVDGCVSIFDDLESGRVYEEDGYWYMDRSQCIA